MKVRVKNPIRAGDGDSRHGTSGGYTNHGCRCEDCYSAFKVQYMGWRDRVSGSLDPGDSRHGTWNGYTNYGCRCDACVTACWAYGRQRRAS